MMEAYVAWLGGQGSVMFQSKQRLTHLGHIGSAGEGDRVEGLGQASKLRLRRHFAIKEKKISETEPCCKKSFAEVTG